MSYASTNLNLVIDFDGRVPAIWTYSSSDPSSQVASTGFFSGAGRGSPHGSPPGLAVNDIVFVRESSAGATPGRCTLHSAVASTPNGSTVTSSTWGYDISLSATAA